MTPSEKQELKQHLKRISEILVKNTPQEKLKDFESIELTIREHMLTEIGPEIADFFYTATETTAGRFRQVNSIVGKVKITTQQAKKLTLKKNTRHSPFLEKSCLLLVANESFKNAELDLEKLTGISIPASTQHRLVEKYQFPETKVSQPISTLSLDGGKVRVRTPRGQESQWKDYKAISLHDDVCAAFFQNNTELLRWVNAQPKSGIITCVGDGHDGIWNLITKIGEYETRREVLDWYHLMENLSKIEAHPYKLKIIKNYLWHGDIEMASAELKTIKKLAAFNFNNYLNKHSQRLPDYSLYQQLNICIGSGSVESTIKRIGARIKIAGAQYLSENVPQYLKLRCAYLNGALL